MLIMSIIDDKITKTEAEITRLEAILEDQERYESLKAQGNSGSETRFVDVARIHERLNILENRLSNLRNATL